MELLNSSSRIKNKDSPVYCVKFCPFAEQNIFAAVILNRVEIHEIKKEGSKNSLKLVKSYVLQKKDELYALDWSLNKETNEVILIAGGLNGKLYNVLKSSVFGVTSQTINSTINDIKFNPKIDYLFAAAHQNKSIILYNAFTENPIAIYNNLRIETYMESITVTFDSSGNYMAFGGMTKEIFITNLKDNEQFQQALTESCTKDEVKLTANFNLIHHVCIIQSLHKNYIDMIFWYGKFSFITKSCDGKIIFWYLEGVDKQITPFSTSNGIEIVKQYELFIENCTLWFVRFGVDPFMNYMTIGNSYGEVLVWNLQGDSFLDWTCQVLKASNSEAIARYFSFSNCGKFLVYCTDDGFLTVYQKCDNIDENANTVESIEYHGQTSSPQAL